MNKQKFKFAFRVNGNKDIGMGHLMRCLYLAEHLPGPSLFLINENQAMSDKVRESGHECRVISSLTEKDFAVMVHALESYPQTFQETQPSETKELKEIREQLRLGGIDVLITDLLSPSDQYLNVLKETGVFLVSIDELGQAIFPSHLVFNCNAVSKLKKYKTSPETQTYVGKEYILLRGGFLKSGGIAVKKEVQRILVTCGGTDMKGLSIKVLRALKRLTPEVEIVLVKGIDFKFKEELSSLLRGMKDVHVLENVKEMSPIMLSVDVAIASGGMTMYELAALGIPSVILDQYEHQNEFATEMERKGAVINLGLGEKAAPSAIENAVVSILPFQKRKEISLAARDAIDGRGAQRVAAIIQERAA